MIPSFLTNRVSVVLALVGIGLLMTDCRPSQQAFVHYQRPKHPVETGPAAPLSGQQLNRSLQTDTLPATGPALLAEQGSVHTTTPTNLRPKAHHVRNPESQESRRGKWLRQMSVNNDPTVAEFAPRHKTPALTTKRKVPGLVKASLVGGLLSHGLLLLGTASGAIWVLAMLVPLASVLLGVAGLAKVTRRRDEYRGKGWAMSAILLATGALGLALVAAAALATSEIVWK